MHTHRAHLILSLIHISAVCGTAKNTASQFLSSGASCVVKTRSLTPVSYTHLDVYKRQEHGGADDVPDQLDVFTALGPAELRQALLEGDDQVVCILSLIHIFDLFIEDGAYTTLSSAVVILVVPTLLFSSTAAIWSMSRAGDTQVAADSGALAGDVDKRQAMSLQTRIKAAGAAAGAAPVDAGRRRAVKRRTKCAVMDRMV